MTTQLDAVSARRSVVNWQADPTRACRNASPELFFPFVIDPTTNDEIEPAYPPPETKAFCDFCSVKTDCLEWALNTGQEFGIFGGMTSYERGLIMKPRSRATCPGCPSNDVIVEGTHQLCLACGLSWPVIS